MTGFESLRNLPELRPEPGQADAALAKVHDRRRRSAVRTATAGAAAVLTAFVVSSYGPSSSTLRQTDEGVLQTATAVPSPTGHGGETDGVTGPRLATATAAPNKVPGVTGGGGGGASPGGDGAPLAPSPTPAQGARPPVRPRPEMTRETYSNITNPMHSVPGGTRRGCGPTAANGTCATVNAQHADGYVTLIVTICSGTDAVDLEFPGEQEADAVVRTKAGAEVWHWARGMTFAEDDRHVVRLESQQCVSWSVPWDYKDEYGLRVPSGNYMVYLPVLTSPRRDMGSSITVP